MSKFFLELFLIRNPIKLIRAGLPFSSRKGITIIELMIVLSIIATLAGIAAPSYVQYFRKVKGAEVIDDIRAIERNIELYKEFYNSYPKTLADIGDVPNDPWGNPYQYLATEHALNGKKDMKKDRNLRPVNTDYDLFSMGENGETKDRIDHKLSLDDIIRCNNGEFVGYARDY